MTASEYQQLIEFLSRKFAGIEARLDSLEARMSSLEARVSSLEIRFEEFRHDIRVVGERVEANRAAIERNGDRIAAVELKLEAA